MKKSNRKMLLIAGKCVLACALMAWALRGLKSPAEPDKGLLDVLAEIWQYVLGSDWLLLGLGALANVIGTTICAYRIQILLNIQEIRVGLGELIRLTFLGQFFNNVIPGSVGGDLVKAYYLAKHTSHKARVVVSVFVDRVLGLGAMVVLAAVMVVAYLWAGLGAWRDIHDAIVVVIVLVCGLVFVCAFILSGSFRRLFHLEKIYGRLSYAHHFAAAGEGAQRLGRHLLGVFWATVVTFISQMFWIGSIWVIGVSLHIHRLTWYDYFLYVPLVYVVGAVPLTPGGIGIIENAYVMFLGQSLKKIPAADVAGRMLALANNRMVMALALMTRAVQLVWSLPGILFALQGTRVPKADAIEAELGLEDTPAQA
ncbi:MAG: lysylphosphatidylglycerol synthase transmembrane domain-containing protein [Planctomycetaceae bacterium]|nr:flippase-like domain-containing protein [Planctomycetaceae bacterium]